MNYTLIGCGRISPNHIQAAIDNKLNIVALCDVDADKIGKALNLFKLSPDIKQYTDYKEMIKNENIDIAAIATESGKHSEIALNCIEKNINTIIEKPIALSLSDADKIIEAAEEHHVKVSISHQNRFNKSIKKIREAVDNNKFGRLFYGTAQVRWNRGEDYYKKAAWRGTWEQDGGALMNQCIHNVDILLWMMGSEVSEVMAYTDKLAHDYIEAEDFGIALIKFKNGAYGVIEGTTDIYPENLEETLYIFGEKGTVKAGGKSLNTIEQWRFGDKSDNEEEIKRIYSENPPNVYGFGHKPLYADMIDAIKNNRRPYVDGNTGRRALELVLAIYKSAALGKPVTLPLEKCSTIDFKGRF
ncbi:Gfo/Idh/MocA family protein [Clostridium oryzae]|uniref:1,5-anhydro-D-fructose reductase n=1 Tax=Clostridium oryzae TaxID=1450648 RepID=A0A1V4IYW6_9CLOT|nr:Gfo/Idh/MocA family oxidoreductase [Clostridium oryzae]OPJ65093.1 1,5-anhydro-D-fructose reductase [Clostridium oryzae]